MAPWGVLIKPGEPYTLQCEGQPRRIRLSKAKLCKKDGYYHPSSARSVVCCSIGTQEAIYLCALSLKTVKSCQLDLEFEESKEIVFSVRGLQVVHLTGYYLDSPTSTTMNATATTTHGCNVDSFREEYKENGNGHSIEQKSEQNVSIDHSIPDTPLNLPHNFDGSPKTGARSEEQDSDKNLCCIHDKRHSDRNIFACEKESILLDMKNEVQKYESLENVIEQESFSRNDRKISSTRSPNESKKRKMMNIKDYEQNLDYDMKRNFDEQFENLVVPDTDDDESM